MKTHIATPETFDAVRQKAMAGDKIVMSAGAYAPFNLGPDDSGISFVADGEVVVSGGKWVAPKRIPEHGYLKIRRVSKDFIELDQPVSVQGQAEIVILLTWSALRLPILTANENRVNFNHEIKKINHFGHPIKWLAADDRWSYIEILPLDRSDAPPLLRIKGADNVTISGMVFENAWWGIPKYGFSERDSGHYMEDNISLSDTIGAAFGVLKEIPARIAYDFSKRISSESSFKSLKDARDAANLSMVAKARLKSVILPIIKAAKCIKCLLIVGENSIKAVPAAVEMFDVKGCTITNCTVRRIRGNGAMLNHGCENCLIQDCKFTDIGANGILVQGGRNNKIAGCRICNCGTMALGSSGIWHGAAQQTQIYKNEISNIPWSGIRIGSAYPRWTNRKASCVVKGNAITDVCKKLGDGAGIYVLGAQPRVCITDNTISEVHSSDLSPLPSSGLFLDLTRGVKISENRISKINGPLIKFYGCLPRDFVWDRNGLKSVDAIKDDVKGID